MKILLDWATKKLLLLHKPSPPPTSHKLKRPLVESDEGSSQGRSSAGAIEEAGGGIIGGGEDDGTRNGTQLEILTIGMLGIGDLLSGNNRSKSNNNNNNNTRSVVVNDSSSEEEEGDEEEEEEERNERHKVGREYSLGGGGISINEDGKGNDGAKEYWKMGKEEGRIWNDRGVSRSPPHLGGDHVAMALNEGGGGCLGDDGDHRMTMMAKEEQASTLEEESKRKKKLLQEELQRILCSNKHHPHHHHHHHHHQEVECVDIHQSMMMNVRRRRRLRPTSSNNNTKEFKQQQQHHSMHTTTTTTTTMASNYKMEFSYHNTTRRPPLTTTSTPPSHHHHFAPPSRASPLNSSFTLPITPSHHTTIPNQLQNHPSISRTGPPLGPHLHNRRPLSSSDPFSPLYDHAYGILEVPTKQMACYHCYTSDTVRRNSIGHVTPRSQHCDFVFHESSINALIRSRALHCSSPSPPTHVVSCQNYIRKLPHALLLYRCLIKQSSGSYYKCNSNVIPGCPHDHHNHCFEQRHNNRKVDKVYQVVRKSMQGLKKGKSKKSSKNKNDPGAAAADHQSAAIMEPRHDHLHLVRNVDPHPLIQSKPNHVSNKTTDYLDYEASFAAAISTDLELEVVRSPNNLPTAAAASTTMPCSRLEAEIIDDFNANKLRNLTTNMSSTSSSSSSSSTTGCLLHASQACGASSSTHRNSWVIDQQNEDSANLIHGCWIKTDDEYVVLEL